MDAVEPARPAGRGLSAWRIRPQSLYQARVRVLRDHEKRIDFLRRIRTDHVKIANSWLLITAHLSARTYTEQLRELIRVKPDLEEIAEDLTTAGNLFDKATDEIVGGIRQIVDYLNEGVKEYK